MYQFTEDYDREIFFWFDKKLIENKNWALLPAAAKAVYPVIACHQNKKGVAYPGESTIGILSGNTEKTVRGGIMGLEDLPGFTVSPYMTKRGRRSKKFILAKPPETKGRSFPFFKSILESGLWAHLKPTAQALYPVMRYYSYFDYSIYSEEEEIDCSPDEFDQYFKDRKWELCEAQKDLLIEYAGITRRSLPAALNSLYHESLIEDYAYEDEIFEGWKVIVRPQVLYKRDYLNGKNYRSMVAKKRK